MGRHSCKEWTLLSQLTLRWVALAVRNSLNSGSLFLLPGLAGLFGVALNSEPFSEKFLLSGLLRGIQEVCFYRLLFTNLRHSLVPPRLFSVMYLKADLFISVCCYRKLFTLNPPPENNNRIKKIIIIYLDSFVA